MPGFRFSALDAAGHVSAATEWAQGVPQLRQALGARGLLLLSASEDRERGRRARLDPVSLRTLASLLTSGLPLTQALRLASELAAPGSRRVLDNLLADVAGGSSLHDAMATRSTGLPRYHLALIRAGERGGDLPGSLARVADSSEHDAQAREQLLTACLYPAVLTVAALVSLLIIGFFVLPRFATLFADMGVELPPLTRALLLGAELVSSEARVLGLLAGAVSLGLGSTLRTARSRARVLVAVLRIPGLGSLVRSICAARFGRTLATLLAGGTPVVEALQEVERSFPDSLIGTEASRIHELVRTGTSLSEALAASIVLPRAFCRLVSAGERSGRLSELVGRAAEMFEQEVTRQIARGTRVIEPAVTLTFGLVVGAMALALMQAVYGIDVGQVR